MSLAPVLQIPSVRNVPSPAGATDQRAKNFLTEPEMLRLLQAAKQGRYGIRDYALLLVGYRHGLRVSELVRIRPDHLRLDEGKLWVKRLKGLARYRSTDARGYSPRRACLVTHP
jgi:integrase